MAAIHLQRMLSGGSESGGEAPWANRPCPGDFRGTPILENHHDGPMAINDGIYGDVYKGE